MRPWAALLRVLACAFTMVLACTTSRGETACEALARERAKAQATAPDGRDRGVLWVLERDGRSSHLYGTLHVGRPGWGKLGPRLRQALEASDVLALELDIGDPAVVTEFARSLPAMPEPPAALNARLLEAIGRACGDARQAAAQPPLLRLLMLTLLDARREGLEASLGAEFLLLASARELGRPVVSLERAADQAQALAPERPADFELQLQASLEQLDDGRSREMVRRLVAAWERGDVADLADYPRWCGCMDTERDRAWNARLNDQRNPQLAARISALHAAGQRVFAAVGVLHLTGAEALPSLLARQGFTLRQVVLQ